MSIWFKFLLALVVVSALSVSAAEPTISAPSKKPQRIVSINLCTDQLLLSLADLDNVASVTWLALDPLNSVVADLAAEVTVINKGAAEEILPLQPDLVLAGAYTTPFTIQMLRRFGFNVEVLDIPQNLSQVQEQILKVGEMLHETERAMKIVQSMNSVLDEIPPDSNRPLRTIVFQPGGFTVGPGSFEHELITIAGLKNIAEEAGISYYGFLSLEELLLLGPNLLVSPEQLSNRPSISESILDHPAMHKVRSGIKTITIPQSLWSCAGPMNVAAVSLLANARAMLIKNSLLEGFKPIWPEELDAVVLDRDKTIGAGFL